MRIIERQGLFALCVAMLIIVCPGISRAAEPGKLDVMLLFGASGGKKTSLRNDPRTEVARLLLSLLDKQDRAGLLIFGDSVDTLVPLSPVGKSSKLVKTAARTGSKGVYADLRLGLEKGLGAFDRGTGSRKAIILMTDGPAGFQNSGKADDKADGSRERLLSELAKSGVAVHAVALAESVDRRFLENAASKTGGSFRFVQDIAGLHKTALDIFEALKAPSMQPVTGNRLRLDRFVEKLTLIAGKEKPGITIFVKSPSGKEYSRKTKEKNIEWQTADFFEAVTIAAPAEGTWSVLFSAGKDLRAYPSTAVRFESDMDKQILKAGKPAAVKVWFEKSGAVVKEGELFDGLEVLIEATGKDGSVISSVGSARDSKGQIQKAGDVISLKYTPSAPGPASLKLIAKGRAIEQMRGYSVNVGEREKTKSPEAGTDSDKTVDAKTPEPKAAPVAAPPSAAREASDRVDWPDVLLKFALINVCAIIAVYAMVRLRNRRKGAPEDGKSAEDAIKEEKGDAQD